MMDINIEERSKKYSKTKIILSIVNISITLVFLIFILVSGLSQKTAEISYSISANDYLSFLIFVGLLGLMESVITLPLSFYSGYYLEHKYSLSNQKFFSWVWEKVKSLLVSVPITVPLLLIFLFLLKNYPNTWWFWIGLVMFFFSVVLARIAPILIFPLFYKFVPLENPELKNRIQSLCDKVKINITGIFSFNMSKETKKANAGFTGIGKSKRIIIGDTLLEKFSIEEIEIVFAHELGHYKYGHIWKGMIVSTVLSFLGLYLVSVLYLSFIPVFGFSKINDIAAFPLLGLIFFLYSLVLMPLTNAYSRSNEILADDFAVKITNNPEAFSSTMLKLNEQNLSDKNPNPVIEFIFYSHPSTQKRIENIRKKYDNSSN
jgi:STE24 endopeptidase